MLVRRPPIASIKNRSQGLIVLRLHQVFDVGDLVVDILLPLYIDRYYFIINRISNSSRIKIGNLMVIQEIVGLVVYHGEAFSVGFVIFHMWIVCVHHCSRSWISIINEIGTSGCWLFRNRHIILAKLRILVNIFLDVQAFRLLCNVWQELPWLLTGLVLSSCTVNEHLLQVLVIAITEICQVWGGYVVLAFAQLGLHHLDVVWVAGRGRWTHEDVFARRYGDPLVVHLEAFLNLAEVWDAQPVEATSGSASLRSWSLNILQSFGRSHVTRLISTELVYIRSGALITVIATDTFECFLGGREESRILKSLVAGQLLTCGTRSSTSKFLGPLIFLLSLRPSFRWKAISRFVVHTCHRHVIDLSSSGCIWVPLLTENFSVRLINNFIDFISVLQDLLEGFGFLIFLLGFWSRLLLWVLSGVFGEVNDLIQSLHRCFRSLGWVSCLTHLRLLEDRLLVALIIDPLVVSAVKDRWRTWLRSLPRLRVVIDTCLLVEDLAAPSVDVFLGDLGDLFELKHKRLHLIRELVIFRILVELFSLWIHISLSISCLLSQSLKVVGLDMLFLVNWHVLLQSIRVELDGIERHSDLVLPLWALLPGLSNDRHLGTPQVNIPHCLLLLSRWSGRICILVD